MASAAAPVAKRCPARERLLDMLKRAIQEINRIHDDEIAAAVRGDLAGLEALQPGLASAREYRDVVVASLKAHLTEHGC